MSELPDNQLAAIDTPSVSGIDITSITKFKHADLYAAALKLGSQSALARYLDIADTELGKWINLKGVPPRVAGGSRWTDAYLLEMEAKLLKLTGKSWEELFPEVLRSNTAFLKADKTIERTARLEGESLAKYAIARRDRSAVLIESAEVVDSRQKTIDAMLAKCSKRSAAIITMRFGLDGEVPLNLEEVARRFKITRERVRQIESHALRIMHFASQGVDAELLETHCENCGEFVTVGKTRNGKAYCSSACRETDTVLRGKPQSKFIRK